VGYEYFWGNFMFWFSGNVVGNVANWIGISWGRFSQKELLNLSMIHLLWPDLSWVFLSDMWQFRVT
jgi:hypothetical protein